MMNQSPLLPFIKGSMLGILAVLAMLVWNLWLHGEFDAPAVPWPVVSIVTVMAVGVLMVTVNLANRIGGSRDSKGVTRP